MECLKLLESLELLGDAGICVGTEHSQLLRNSLTILQKENHFRKCYYWGKIYGTRNDYHIAYGFEKDCMDGQVYYYSTDCFDWFLLPNADKCAQFLTPLAINKFEGDPSIVTNVNNVNPPFPPNEDPTKYYESGILSPRRYRIVPESQHSLMRMYQGPVPKELKEEDRLAATVCFIREDAAIIPRGAWFKCPSGDVIENPSFEGLDPTDSTHLKSYLHARPPQQKWNTNLLTRPDYNYATDFLDTIDVDVPQGCWSLQLLYEKNLALLHSLYWPGMTFYHKMNSPHHGFLYFGHGKKNLDVVFMV